MDRISNLGSRNLFVGIQHLRGFSAAARHTKLRSVAYLFLLPACLSAAIGTPVLWTVSGGRVFRAVLGAIMGLLLSIAIGCIGCAIVLAGEAQAWFGIPMVHQPFFVAITGSMLGWFWAGRVK